MLYALNLGFSCVCVFVIVQLQQSICCKCQDALYEDTDDCDLPVQDQSQEDIMSFMGLPTMYSYLLSAYDEMTPTEQGRARYEASMVPSIV